MPLIDLKTDLKSLKYGHDRPGGGDSGQPYMKNDINNPINTLGFDDGLVRGGAIGAIKASVIDTLRIGKFLTDLPKGPLFIAKQVGLQLSNPKLETTVSTTGIGFIDNIANSISKLGIGPTRIYNLGINTIAQVPVNAFGIHFNRHGLLPIQDDNTKYLAVAKLNNENNNNRLVGYVNTLLPTPFTAVIPKSRLLQALLAIIPGGSNFASPQQQTISSYTGGPNSVYGIGKTFIRRYDYTARNKTLDQGKIPVVDYSNTLGVSNDYFDDDEKANNITNDGHTIATNSAVDFSSNPIIGKYAQLQEKIKAQSQNNIFNYNENKNTNSGILGLLNLKATELNGYTDKSISYNNGIDKPIVIKGSWKTMNRETRIGSGRQDTINLTPIFTMGDNGKPGNSVFINGKKQNTRDLIKFRIGAIDTDEPTRTNWMVFRAYLTGFQDSFNAEWSDIKYIGRGEKFKLYNGFDRSVTFSFKVAALSAQEMEPMYQKLNYLASNMMPDYKDNVMRGPFMKLTVGDYLNAQPGIFTSVQYSIDETSPWEISIDNPEGGSTMYDLPHIINVSATFIPIGVRNGDLPERKVSTPIMLQSDMKVDGVENPWLKLKVNDKAVDLPLAAYLLGKEGRALESTIPTPRPTLQVPNAPTTFNGNLSPISR